MHIIDKYKGKRIAIGTHGNIMAIMMNYFDKKYDYSFWKSLSMPAFPGTEQPTLAKANTLKRKSYQIVGERIGETVH